MLYRYLLRSRSRVSIRLTSRRRTRCQRGGQSGSPLSANGHKLPEKRKERVFKRVFLGGVEPYPNAELFQGFDRLFEDIVFGFFDLDLSSGVVFIVRADQYILIAQLFAGHLCFGPDIV